MRRALRVSWKAIVDSPSPQHIKSFPRDELMERNGGCRANAHAFRQSCEHSYGYTSGG
jgi:hypothetical protein